MIHNHKVRLFAVVLAFASLFAAQLGCSLFGGQASAPPPPIQVEEIEEPGNQEGSLPGEGETSAGDQGEGVVEPQFGQDTLPCPAKGSILTLGFDHALTVNYQETSLSHFLHQGWINLKVVDDSGTIASTGTATLTYSMEGRMSAECTLTGEGEMVPNAHGSCEAGVVSLIIEENWGPLQGEMVCVDEDGDVTRGPFNVPAMGLQTHSGQDGTGEIFYLVEGSDGYSTMRPFAEGEGYHTWTLYAEDIPLVPLVPED
jgi:hypothetical protein